MFLLCMLHINYVDRVVVRLQMPSSFFYLGQDSGPCDCEQNTLSSFVVVELSRYNTSCFDGVLKLFVHLVWWRSSV